MIQIHPEISPRAYKIFREILILIGFRAEAPIWNRIVGLLGKHSWTEYKAGCCYASFYGSIPGYLT